MTWAEGGKTGAEINAVNLGGLPSETLDIICPARSTHASYQRTYCFSGLSRPDVWMFPFKKDIDE
ncbi:MAG: hypothetical protein E3J35_03645 [Methanomassiliicoccales archaeon]|nr:MAG: hypothetical protein E3J35_03645 [Methanomassiliicoccales archaeon]